MDQEKSSKQLGHENVNVKPAGGVNSFDVTVSSRSAPSSSSVTKQWISQDL